ncbi:hypothetical protein HanXRQr2_Chr14g0669171 [Helianthus annuus]|uniref:Uncharacterized protein n=1 Tax=Helianthus annuus TaxID=4232 RepID=A0A251SM62_HELAN|nr:hypothetical protein HanXRQr2_Chr14g0669171 [Helianthus annuus]KAJ0842498.1 hypothetical protein HanPSC8_Chr14g0642371 [Helianthus annuus]
MVLKKMDDIIDAFALDSTKKRNRSQERNVITTRRGVLSLYLYGYFDCGIYLFC